jgi:hypothetical protein
MNCEPSHKPHAGSGIEVDFSLSEKFNFLGPQVKRGLSALEQQAADALRRARGLPVGADRNDLRQLATGLLWLHRNGMDALTRLRLEDHFDGGSIDPSGENEPVANPPAD